MTMRRPGLWFAALLLWLGAAAANPVSTENVTARLLLERTAAAPGTAVELALELDIRPGWHTYWSQPGDSGEPPRIDWDLPEGVVAGSLRFPHPELIRVGPLANYGYSGRALHLVTLEVPADWPAGQPLTVTANATWLVCEEHCIPESAALTLTIPTADHAGPADLAVADLFRVARDGLPRELPGTATLAVRDGTLQLTVEGLPAGLDPATAWFFGSDWGLIEHAAGQAWHWRGERLTADLIGGELATQAAPTGVLVATLDGQRVAYRIEAEPVTGPASQSGAGDGDASANVLGLPLALALALVGGLILNLMPCVFPVLAMKALSLTGEAAPGRRERVAQGLAYTAGVLVFFAFVAGLLLALRASGQAIGWGYQLQYPPFVAGMAYLFFVLGLSLVGAVTLGGRLMGIGAAGPTSGPAGAFATGALAALVAAPCTAPFMGTALGYGLTLPWPAALTVMLTLGLGLALPYLLLALVPSAARLLPRPGPWMGTLKQFLAFPLFATAIWLVWVLAVQTGPDGVASVLGGALLLALGLWVRERTLARSDGARLVGGGTALAGLAAALALAAALGMGGPPAAATAAAAQGGPKGLTDQPYSAARLQAARDQGQPVFVNMTAAWCITCLVNERVALSSARVAEAFAARDLVYLKGDWTNRDPAITDYLEGFGRSGVPIYVLYLAGAEPRVLPQILTESIVLAALQAGAP